MRRFRLFCIACLLLTASGVLSEDIHTSYNFDKTADFSKFKTYKWVVLKSESPIDKLTDEQIKATLEATFAQKGLRKVEDDGSADLLVGYQSEEGLEGPYEQLPGYVAGWPLTGKPPMKERGQLTVDMYDPANHKLIWRGVANKVLENTKASASPKKIQNNLNKAVAKLMENYPPLK